ncbi:uncharacterized protein (UPF0210 family) [Flavobacterium sp. 28A]|uniref:MBG domain-containing protein n=1 Tax=Flavobacterium sp. 28A TaxID=2735895 RepID=UPI00156E4EFE|nr:MBG domain-containing protein [Flavobacterium sp. 28A]NRT16167.1 uncharacterized protein (UPF0210 family) [Flavobacterium sp. 28A]
MRKITLTITLFLLIFAQVVLAQTIKYVKVGGSGTKDGTSWSNASDNLQKTISLSSGDTQIWIAKGKYTPKVALSPNNNPQDRDNTFGLKKDVKLYGGFSGVETSITDRNIASNETILSGDLGGGNFAYHVMLIHAIDANEKYYLNGLTISDGKCNDSGYYNISEEISSSISVNDQVKNKYPDWYVAMTESPYYNFASIGLQLAGENALPGVVEVPGGNAVWVQISKTSYPKSKGGGIYNIKGELKLENVTFKNNSGILGAALSTELGGRTTINDCTFANNKATNNGGAIVNTESYLTITGGTFNNNSALLGGAIVDDNGKLLSIKKVYFVDNKAISNQTDFGFGGAIFIEKVTTDQSAGRVIDGCTFEGNTAHSAGAIYAGPNISKLEIYNSTFSKNSALVEGNETQIDGGGAIKLQKTINTVLESNDFDDNLATKGIGGACIVEETNGVVFRKNTFSRNISLSGGALYLSRNSNISIKTTNTFTKNSATNTVNLTNAGLGGAIGSLNNFNIEIATATFTENTATIHGGAIYFVSSTDGSKTYTNTINGNTFDSNNAVKVGGALFVSSAGKTIAGQLAINNNTFNNNSSNLAGGSIFLNYAIATQIEKNTFTGNKSYLGAVLDVESTAKTLFFNNTVKSNVGTTSAEGNTGGVITTIAGENKLYNNVFTGNSGFTAVFHTNSTVDLVNNTVWKEVSYDGIYLFSKNVKIYNNILVDVSGPNASSADVKNNAFKYDPDFVGKNNNVQEGNLYFVDEANNNFNLTGCSPILNKGDSSLYSDNYDKKDILGNTRKVNAIDIGAYENKLGVSGKTAPTVVATQAFCNETIVNNLQPSGTAFKWYSQASGGSSLANNTFLVSGTTYYASQTIDGCESERAAVAVSISSTVAPTAQSPQNFIIGQQGAKIVVNGSNLKWYTQEAGGTASTVLPSLNMASENSATYWVSQTNANNCESTRTKIVVNVTKIPLTVKAIDKIKVYDGSVYGNSNYTVTYAGFESGDSVSNSITGELAFSGTATLATEPGSYKIIPQGISSNKYTVLFEEGTLEIKSNLILTDNTLYVKQSGNGDGTSWNSPLNNLELALTRATNINKVHTSDADSKKVKRIFVAKGTYQLAAGKSYVMPNNIEIYGGFDPDNGVINLTNQRITGILNDGSVLRGSSASVIKNDNNSLTNTAVLNGFTITNGTAINGGGVYNKNGSPKFENCIIKSNNATVNGGAVYNEKANTTWINCLIINNTAPNGASIYNDASLPTLLNTTIADNTGAQGATFYNANGSSPRIVNTISVKNSSDIVNNTSTPNYENSLIQGINGVTSTTNVFNTDYTLLAVSPALNAGANNPSNINFFPSKDLKGKLRIINTTVDMGVFERNITQTITAANITKKYGDAAFTHGTASSGLPLVYVSSSNTAIATIEDGKIKVVGVGTTTITLNQPGNDIYDAAPNVTFILTSEKATLTVSADNKVKLQDGNVFTGFTVSYSGFVFDDNLANSLSGTVNYTGTAVATTAIGINYIITPSGYSSTKYDIIYTDGNLRIEPNLILTNGIMYVKKGATGNGTSWANALGEVRDALDIATIINSSTTPGSTKATNIFVSVGSYSANSGQSFKMLAGVSIYGGFDPDNGITTLTQKRKFAKSILSSGSDNRGITNDNNGLTNADIIDGFTISNSGSSGVNVLASNRGAGIYNKNSSPTIVNCIIKDNQMFPFFYEIQTFGGGIYNDNSNPVLINCIIKNNKVGVDRSGNFNGHGSAIYNANNSNPKLYNCTITDNKSISLNNANAPAIFNDANSTTSLYNSIYMNNNIGVSTGILSYNSIVQKDTNILEGVYNNSATVANLDQIFKVNSTDLKEDSFAKDKGNNTYYSFTNLSAYDINGYNRLSGTIDVGAEELRSVQIITAADITKTYGEIDFTHSSASVNSSLPLTYTKSSDITVAAIKDGKINILKAGTTTITIAQVGNENYAPTEKTFVLTVGKVTLTVKANDKAKFANNAAMPNADYDVSFSGFVYANDRSKLTGSLLYSGSAIGKKEIGIYTDGIIPSGLSSNNYDFVYQKGTLKILPNTTLTNNTLYVKEGAVGGDGSSWQLALNDLSLALRNATILNSATAKTVDQIYVAKGTYTPKYSVRDDSNFIDEGKDNSFLIVDGVKLYGGFDGTIANENIVDRKIQENKTILDGTATSYHIITVSNATANNEIDGFTISKGAAAGSDIGSVAVNGKPITRIYGGGIRVHSSNVIIKNCVVSENSSGVIAGGMYVTDQSNVSVYNTLFYGNGAYHYGGNASSIAINASNIKIVNTTFGDVGSGDGIVYASHISTSGVSNLEVFNSIFRDNSFNNDIIRSGGTITIKNSLLSKTQVQYSSMTLANNSYSQAADFVDTTTNNFALKNTSIAIDKGDNTLYDLSIAGNKDIANSSRVLNSKVDMGCYESKIAQTITVVDVTKKYTDADFVIGSASSTLPLTYSSGNKAVAYITKDNEIHIVGVGQATITIAQNGDETYGFATKNFTLTVEKGDFSATLISETYTYDGSQKYLNITGLPTGTSVSYDNNGQINAGEYTVKATISGGQNYNDSTISNTLKINKTDLSGLTFNTGTFTYDGFEKHPVVSGTLPEGVTVVYSNTQKNAGTYSDVKATLSGVNYKVLELNTSMTINKGNLSDAIFLVEKEEVYDGTVKALSLDGILPDGVTATYTNNSNSNVGSYNVTVNINGGLNYNNKQLIAQLTILKGNLDTNVVLTPITYIYDGNEKSLIIDGVLPDQVVVSYSNNNKVNVGTYKVYAVLSKLNYNDKILEAVLIVEPKPLNVISQGEISKVYNANAIITLKSNDFALNGVVSGDDVMLKNPVAGELNNKNIGENKAVTIIDLKLYGADSKNYILSTTTLTATIGTVTSKKLNVSLKGSVTKIYNGTTVADLSATNYELTGVLENEVVILNNPSLGEYGTKDIGEDKTITVSNLTISGVDASNYILSSQTASGKIGVITKKVITVTADAKTKVYGEEDPSLTHTVSPSLETGDSFTGSLTRATGSNVGTYGITSSLSNTNYAITYVPADFTITKKAITVTAAAKTKVYGAEDPSLTHTVSPSLEIGDSFTGSLTRATGSNVGTYGITSSLSNSNYAITYVPADFTITTKAITVTAATKTKVYGEEDPSLTHTVSPSLETGDSFTGSLTRATGSNVGTYGITSSLSNTNYAITYVPADFTITKKAITVTAAAKTKVYGAEDPSLTHTVSPSLEIGDSFTGSLTRATGSNVGTYGITSSLSNSNYAITYVPADFTITTKAITVTAATKTKVYGAEDPSLTHTVSPSLETGDSFTGSLTRATGSNVGTYGITSSLSNTNYAITYVPADFTITTKAITVTAAAKTKVYGAEDPSLTHTVSPSLEIGDSFTGSLTRATGSNVGTYGITSSLSNTNYAITYVPADFTITTKAITVTAATKTKVYGAEDPSLTHTVSPSLETGDSFTGSLTRATGSNVGTYAISSSLSNTNYAITYVPANFTITTKAITVTAAAKTKVYGAEDPSLTHTVSPSLEIGDSFTGSLTRATGSNVGTYGITSSLSNTNYAITYVSADFTITTKAITVTAAAKTKVYGAEDPSLTHTVSPSLEIGDSFTGSLTRATGSNVGTYGITSSLSNTNYAITYVPADFTITAKAITVTAAAKTKIYGTADIALTHTVSPSLETGDSFTGSLTRATGSNVGTYGITSSLSNTNYAITYVPANFTITTKAITVTAAAKTKVYGTTDPSLTYSVSPSLVSGDSFTGSLTRTVGSNVGTYAIASALINTNYAITYVPANFTITKADQQITWNQSLESDCGSSAPIMLTATSSSGLPISYTSSKNNVAAVSSGVLNFANYGSATVTATQSGNVNYNAATVVTVSVLNSQPNLIRQQFDNVIFFDNSSNSFKSYAWYKNGVLVSGQTAQYFKDSGVLNGTYYAMATKIDGTVVTSCPLTFTPSIEQEYLKIAPNPVRSDSSYQLFTNVNEVKLQNARVTVFNILGAQISDMAVNSNTVDMNSPSAEGIYIVRLTLASGKYFTKNLLVRN